MLHRTRLNYEMRDRGLAALPEIAALIGEILGWDEQRSRRSRATGRAEAEDAAALEPDDAEAEKVRLRAADVAPMHR